MLKIELIAELRRLGFPLVHIPDVLDRFKPGHEIAESQIPELIPDAAQIAGKWYLEPTLELMFTALGDNFKLLERTDIWGAIGKGNGKQKLAFGADPKEALANLYLEIKK